MGPPDHQRPQLRQLDDVRKIDGDYIDAWFPEHDGYLHKIYDYFEYTADGTGYTNLDEGLRADARHPLIPETYRWHFEKRSHPEDDNWQHLFEFAVAMNTSASSVGYEQTIEAKLDPGTLPRLALRHAVGDWDSYGYNRGKNNGFYYALPEGKWYLLPWDIDFTLGSGRGATGNLFEVGGQFPEVTAFLNYPKYKQMYYDALKELVDGPWKTSYGTSAPPTAFDRYLEAPGAERRRAGRRPARCHQAVRPQPPRLHPDPASGPARHPARETVAGGAKQTTASGGSSTRWRCRPSPGPDR
jgi:hypothetical protein